MASIFTRIIEGEIPCNKIAETEDFFAFLDVFPVRYGHTLIVPKKETDYIFDIDTQAYMELMGFAKTIANAVKKAFPCKKVGMAIIGLEVPHAHIHLIPMNNSGVVIKTFLFLDYMGIQELHYYYHYIQYM